MEENGLAYSITIDDTDAQEGTARVNKALDSVGQRALLSTTVASGAFQSMTSALVASSRASEQAFLSAGNAVSAFSGFVVKSTEASIAMVSAYSAASVAIAHYGAAAVASSNGLDTLVASMRAARIAASALLPEVFGSVAFSTTSVGIGILIEETIRLTNARAKLIEQQSLYAAVNQIPLSAVQRIDTVAAVGGGNAQNIKSLYGALNTRVDSNEASVRSGLDALGISGGIGQKYETLDPHALGLIAAGFASIEDPAKRAATAVQLFGKESAGLALEQLSPKLADASSAVGAFGGVLDETARNQIYHFHQEIESLGEPMRRLETWWNAGTESIKQGAEVIVGALDDMSNRGIKAFDELIRKAPALQALAGAMQNVSVETNDAAIFGPDSGRKLAAGPFREGYATGGTIYDIGNSPANRQKQNVTLGLTADDLFALVQGAKARQDVTVDGLKTRAAAARQQGQTLYDRLAADAEARSLNPNAVDLLSAQDRFDLTTQQQSYSQRARNLDLQAEDSRATDEARLAGRNASRSESNALAQLTEDESIKRLKERSVGPLSADDFKTVLLAGFDKVSREVNSRIEEKRFGIDPTTGNLKDLSDTPGFQKYAAQVQGTKTALVTNEFQRLTFEQEDSDTAHIRQQLDARIAHDQAVTAAKASAQVTLDNALTGHENKATDRQYALDAAQVGRDKSLALQRLDSADAQTITQKYALEDAKLAIDKDYAAKSLDIELSKLKAARDFEVGELTDAARKAGLKFDPTTIAASVDEDFNQQITAAKKASADDLLLHTAEVQAAQTKIVRDGQLEQFDSLKNSIDSVLQASEVKGTNVFKNIGLAAEKALIGAFNQIISSQIAASLFEALNPGQHVSFDQGGQGKGKDGGILGLLGFGRPTFTGGVNSANHLGDVSLVNGAVPVITNLQGQSGQSTGSAAHAAVHGSPITGFNPFAGASRLGVMALQASQFAFAGPQLIDRSGASGGSIPAGAVDNTISYDGGDSETFSSFVPGSVSPVSSAYGSESLGIPGGYGFPSAGSLGGSSGGGLLGLSIPGIGGKSSGGGLNPANWKDLFYNQNIQGTNAAGYPMQETPADISANLGGGIVGDAAGGLAGFATSPAGGALGAALFLQGIKGKSSVANDVQTTAGGGLLGANIGSKIPQLGIVNGALIGGGAGLFASGIKRGGYAGTAEDTAGGALAGAGIGNAIAGPEGALIGGAIGAAAGLLTGIGLQLFGTTDRQHAKDLIKQIYGISISDGIADQIVQLAKQKYGNEISVAVRSQEVRDLIRLYAESIGSSAQKQFVADTVHSASLIEANGRLTQGSIYDNGQAYTYASGLPTLNGISSSILPTIGRDAGPNVTVSSLQLSLNGSSALAALGGQVTSIVTPGFVANAAVAGYSTSGSRAGNQAAVLGPSAINR